MIFNANAGGDSLLGPAFSVGPLALGGPSTETADLDLFRSAVGSSPGVNPEGRRTRCSIAMTGANWWWRNAGKKLGLVKRRGVFRDLDQDGLPEVDPWRRSGGPIRVFQAGPTARTRKRTREWGPGRFHRLVERGREPGIFDGDGAFWKSWRRIGVSNSPYRAASREHPRKLYHGDLDGNGTVDLIEARWGRGGWARKFPRRTFNFNRPRPALLAGSAWPKFRGIRRRKGTREIFGDNLDHASVLEANTP